MIINVVVVVFFPSVVWMRSLPVCAGTICSLAAVSHDSLDQSSLFLSSFVRVERTSVAGCANMGRIE